MIYDNLTKKIAKIKHRRQLRTNYLNGPKLEIIDDNPSNEYLVKFIDNKTEKNYYETTLKGGYWAASSKKYYIEWRIEIWDKHDNKIYEEVLNLENKNVLINFESSALGDTIAWVPYVEEFRKKHKCNIILSTYHNNLFSKKYTNITFVPPGSIVNNLYAQYDMGWFDDPERNPINPYIIPLQQTATDILGLSFKEIKPKIIDLKPLNLKEKYVTISTQSTAQAKYWNYKGGWQQVIKFLKSKGYKTICVDKQPIFGYGDCMNVSPKCDYYFHEKPLEEIMSVIKGAEFHIGIGSGLSWLSWALETHVIMISSFSKPFCEFQTGITRIYNDTPHSGFFNTVEHKLNPGDWNWNPFKTISTFEEWHEFETITPKQVIDKVNEYLGIL